MSITKGSMLISNANAVGAELVNKLGGTGYKPVEWADAINLLGISNDDKASALAGITSGTYTGDARGSIKYSNCNAVGSMLNKKFSTDRGFKPVEWESAISKLTPLAEGTVSGSVVSFSDGADDVPTKSLVVTIPPTLSGTSSVSETQTGRNLFDKTTATIGKYINVSGQEATNEIKAHSVLLPLKPSTSYYMSGYAYGSYYSILALDKDMNVLSTWYGGASKTEPFVATTPNNARWCYLNFNADQIDNVIFAESTTAIPYEAYNDTQYTANLGRTIYGGEDDIVNGVGKDTNSAPVTYVGASSENWQYSLSGDGTKQRVWIYIADAKASSNKLAGNIIEYDPIMSGYPNEGKAWVNSSKSLVIGVPSSITSANDWKTYLSNNNLQVTYELATPESFTFTGQEVPTRLGYNAFWSDSGDTEVTYRKDPDIPDPPVQLLNMNNENNENNDN